MKIELDLTLTLLVKDSVIEVKDGIWQTFKTGTIAETSHFFYLPKSENASISIMYRSSLVTMGIAYTLWKYNEKGINPSEWPFPPFQDEVATQMSSYNSINHVQIDSSSLKGCWPNCIVLMSLYKKKNSLDTSFEGAQFMA